MRLSIIIPTMNKVERLRLALASYEGQTLSRDEFEIIVVADASDVGIEKALEPSREKINLKIIFTPERGMPRVRNLGAEKAVGDRLGFIDDDVMVCPRYLEVCLAALEGTKKHVVRAPVFTLYAMKYFADPELGTPYPQFAAILAQRPALSSARLSREMVRHRWPSIEKQCNKLNRFERIVKASLQPRGGKQALPWMGMSGSGVVLDKESFWAAGGYDDRLGEWWGAESIDFGYRLHQQACTFADLTEIYSCHIDHPRDEALTRFRESFGFVFDKYKDPDIQFISELIWSHEDIECALDRRGQAT